MLYQAHNSQSGYYFECLRYEDFYFVPHIHRHPELIYVRSGTVNVDLGSRVETVCENEYALVLPHCRHGYHTPTHSVVDVCIFSENYVPAFAKITEGRFSKSIRFTCPKSITDFTASELFVGGETPDLFRLKACLYAVLGEFLKTADWENGPGSNDELIDRMIRYIAENYTKDISLEKMSVELGYEKHYLSRCFHDKLHTGFSQYVSWYRIDHAKSLLDSTELSVSEIALQSGFRTIRSFHRAFRQLTGIPPRLWKNSLSEERR